MLLDALYRLRTRIAVLLLKRLAPRAERIRRVEGLELRVAAGGHDPGVIFAGAMRALQRRAVEALSPGARVLDLGTGSGLWALLAARAGAEVTAVDLPEVPAEPLLASAARAGLRVRHLSGDGLGPVRGERFDHVLFNPPFHDGAAGAGEAAWVGGAFVRRVLGEAAEALCEGGCLWLTLPRWEQHRYAEALSRWRVRRVASRWVPLLGRIDLIALTAPRAAPTFIPASVQARAWRQLAALGDIRSCELVELDGRLDPRRLDAAVRVVAGWHPMLRAQPRPGGWSIGEAGPTLVVRDRPEARSGADLLADTWDAGDPDAPRVELVRGATRDWLRMLVPHDRTDARSGERVVADLAEVYGALGEGGGPMPARPDPATWDPQALLPVTGGARRSAVARMVRDLGAPPAWRHAPGAPRGRTRVAVHELPREALPALKQRAAATRTTVHALLVVTAARIFGVGRVMDLMTLRPLATSPVDGRSDVLVVPWVQEVPAGPGAHAAVERAVIGMREGGAAAELARLSLYDGLAGLLPVRLAAGLAFRLFVKADVVLTNPGPAQLSATRFGEVPIADFVNFPQLTPPARAGLVFTTYRGRMRIVALWDEASLPGGVAGEVAALCAALGIAAPAGAASPAA